MYQNEFLCDCILGGRVRFGVPVVKRNSKTVWIKTVKKDGFSRPMDVIIKRHIVKHKVKFRHESHAQLQPT